jgi:hypothetical protein
LTCGKATATIEREKAGLAAAGLEPARNVVEFLRADIMERRVADKWKTSDYLGADELLAYHCSAGGYVRF